MKHAIAVGLTVLAGAALVEVALVPGVVIGGAIILAPRYLPRYLPRSKALASLGMSMSPKMSASLARSIAKPLSWPSALARPLSRPAPRAPAGPAASARVIEPALAMAAPSDAERPGRALARPGVRQAIVKTITFRVIVTTLDFSTNYIVLGELATAAGLSTFALVVGPVFYFIHEAAWNRFGRTAPTDVLPVLVIAAPAAGAATSGRRGIAISRALVKTITFRTFATAMDFTTNYVVVGDVVTAIGLSATGFVLGPFVYLGHEMAWDYYGARSRLPERTIVGGGAAQLGRVI